MKKVLILSAIAALVASAACTKVEPASTPDKAITFQVAKYVPQTKANSAFDVTKSFYTWAWFHPTSGPAQSFMEDETISYSETATTGSGVWQAARLYFWPKSGYVNFFSYAYDGTWATATDPKPTISDATGTTAVTAGTAVYGDPTTPTYITVPVDGDIMLAEAAYRYAASDSEHNQYSINYGTSTTDVKGVATLFHHLLSKVKFQVRFDASEYSGSGYAWNLHVNSLTIKYADKGYLTVNLVDPDSDHTQAWPYAANDADKVNWTPNAAAASLATITKQGASNAGFEVNNSSQSITVNSSSVNVTLGGSASHVASEGVELLGWTSVLPQWLTDTDDATHPGTAATVEIDYTLTSYYSADPTDLSNNPYSQQIQETVNTTAENGSALRLNTFVNSSSEAIISWDMNYMYLYTITIKPNKTVTFDPAVVDWETPINGYYTWPNN